MYVCICICICICMYMCICIYVCVYIYMYVCMYVCICICICVCSVFVGWLHYWLYMCIGDCIVDYECYCMFASLVTIIIIFAVVDFYLFIYFLFWSTTSRAGLTWWGLWRRCKKLAFWSIWELVHMHALNGTMGLFPCHFLLFLWSIFHLFISFMVL